MAEKFTQGEWVVRSGFKVTVGEEQIWIADCYPYHEKHPRPRIIEAEANARLIAQAPRMAKFIERIAKDEGGNHIKTEAQEIIQTLA